MKVLFTAFVSGLLFVTIVSRITGMLTFIHTNLFLSNNIIHYLVLKIIWELPVKCTIYSNPLRVFVVGL